MQSGQWSDVGDLHHTGLEKFGKNYLTQQEAEAHYKPLVSDALNFLETHPALERHRSARKARNEFKGDVGSPEYRELERLAGESIAKDVPYTYAELKALLSSPEDWTDRGETIYRPISTAIEQVEKAKKQLGVDVPPAEGMKRGGKVHISDNPDTMQLELSGGGEVKMDKGGDPKKAEQDLWADLRASIPKDSGLGPIENLKQNLSAVYEGAKKVPGNLYNLATNPVEYIKNLPAPTGEQIINAFSPADMGFVRPKTRSIRMKRDSFSLSQENRDQSGLVSARKGGQTG